MGKIADMQPAKVTTQHTQRHRAKHSKDVNISGEGRRRVFRPVLTSPFMVTWPRVSRTDGEMLMHMLAEALAEARGDEPGAHKPVVGATLGLNAVTRVLQDEIQAHSAAPVRAAPRILFVCQGDADPESLVGHIPMLVCSYNAACISRGVADADSLKASLPTVPAAARPPLLLVPLPSGAELLLSTAAGLRRLSAVLVDGAFPQCEALVARVGPVVGTEGMRAPWLDDLQQRAPSLQAVRVKHMSTSAPSNMAAARAQKKAGRASRRKKMLHG